MEVHFGMPTRASAEEARCLNKRNGFHLATRRIGAGAVEVHFGMPSRASAEEVRCLNKRNGFHLATRRIGAGAVEVHFGVLSRHLLRKRGVLTNSLDFI